MSQAPSDLIGRLAVHYKLISIEQLAAATQEQTRAPTKKLGAILVELGFIDSTQLAQLVEAQRQYLAHQAQQGARVLRESPQQRPGPPPVEAIRHKAPDRSTVDDAVQWLHRV